MPTLILELARANAKIIFHLIEQSIARFHQYYIFILCDRFVVRISALLTGLIFESVPCCRIVNGPCSDLPAGYGNRCAIFAARRDSFPHGHFIRNMLATDGPNANSSPRIFAWMPVHVLPSHNALFVGSKAFRLGF